MEDGWDAGHSVFARNDVTVDVEIGTTVVVVVAGDDGGMSVDTGQPASHTTEDCTACTR
jgi:hypothetical protein